MKRKRFSLKSCAQQFVDLPDDCWELVFSLIKNNGDDNDDDNSYYYLKSLSVASKQFLSITNRHKLSLTILYPTSFHLPRLLQRFTNLILINLSSYYGDLNFVLSQISCFPLNHLRSLNLSNQETFPAIGLRAFSKTITTLTSLNCSDMDTLNGTDLKLIADCFPLLEELDLSYPKCLLNNDNVSCYAGLEAISLSLFKLRKVNLSRHNYINDELIFQLCKNCKFLEEAITVSCPLLTAGVACALRQRPTLWSIYFECLHISNPQHVTSYFTDSILCLKDLTSIHLLGWHISDQFLSSIAMENLPLRRLELIYCTGYTYSGIFYLLSKCQRIQHLNLQYNPFLNNTCVADLFSLLPELVSINLSKCCNLSHLALFPLVRNCPSLIEINMEYTYFEENSIQDNPNFLKDRVVNPQLKSLSLADGFRMQNESIIMLAAIFPNLQRLNLSNCFFITEEGIGQVLRSCLKIRHLDLSFCMKVKSLGIHFEVPKLEMLNLTNTKVDDEALIVISKRCPGLLQLVLQNCKVITTEGVMHVVKSCTQLKEINLIRCLKVHATVVASMVLSRPSLRKVAPPPGFPLSDKNRKHFSGYGCLLETFFPSWLFSGKLKLEM